MTLRFLYTASALLIGTTHLFGAPDNATASYQSTPRNQAAEVEEDLGVIEPVAGDAKGAMPQEPQEPRTKFRGNVGVRSDFTSNAKLQGDHSSGDVLFLPNLEFGMNSKFGPGFAFDIATKVESVFYARYDERAFIGYSVPMTLEWRPTPHCPRIYIGAEPYRYDSFDTGDRITQAIGVSAGTDYGYAFNNGNTLAFIGYSFTQYYSDPTIDNRYSHRPIVGLAHQFKPNLFGQCYYQWQYTDYENAPRHDSRHVVSASMIYQFNRHLFGNIGASFIDNDSSQRNASYQAVVASLGIAWQF